MPPLLLLPASATCPAAAVAATADVVRRGMPSLVPSPAILGADTQRFGLLTNMLLPPALAAAATAAAAAFAASTKLLLPPAAAASLAAFAATAAAAGDSGGLMLALRSTTVSKLRFAHDMDRLPGSAAELRLPYDKDRAIRTPTLFSRSWLLGMCLIFPSVMPAGVRQDSNSSAAHSTQPTAELHPYSTL
jgi:hypothetical protein